MSLEELEREEKRLIDLLMDTKLRLHEARVAASGVAVGDVVLSNGREFKITQVDTAFRPPWLRGVARIKDGSWGKGERHLYSNWQKL